MSRKTIAWIVIPALIVLSTVAIIMIDTGQNSGVHSAEESQNQTSSEQTEQQTTVQATQATTTAATEIPTTNRPRNGYIPDGDQFDIEEALEYADSLFFIHVSLDDARLTVYERSDTSLYDQPVMTAVIGYGANGKTRLGFFYTQGGDRWTAYDENHYVQYAVTYHHEATISTALYRSKDINTLDRGSYTKIGTDATEGLIITTAQTAHWIYQNCSMNTPVWVTQSADDYPHAQDEATQDESVFFPQLEESRYFTDPTDPMYQTLEELETEGLLPYRLYFEKGSFTLTVYGKDDEGAYSKVIHRFLSASGRTMGRTPAGEFELGHRERWHQFRFDGGYAQYAIHYTGSLYIHGPVYGTTDITTMFGHLYKEIGTASTAGCLRTTTYAAYWIYTYCPPGTPLEIVNGSPLGTTSDELPPIGGNFYETDPTDPLNPDSIY